MLMQLHPSSLSVFLIRVVELHQTIDEHLLVEPHPLVSIQHQGLTFTLSVAILDHLDPCAAMLLANREPAMAVPCPAWKWEPKLLTMAPTTSLDSSATTSVT